MSTDYIKAAVAALEAHHQEAGLEPTTETHTKLWHLLLSIIEFCDAQKLDFDATVSDVRDHFESESRIEIRDPADEWTALAPPRHPLQPLA